MTRKEEEVSLLELITGAMSLAGKTSKYSAKLVQKLFDEDQVIGDVHRE